jgi:hypothetical protein
MNEYPTKIILEYYDDNCGYWSVTSNLKHSCIAAHGKTPQEALASWMDLWMWDNPEARKYIQHCCHCDSEEKQTCPDCLVYSEPIDYDNLIDLDDDKDLERFLKETD